MTTFLTADGYTLRLEDGIWTDGDIDFANDNGWPVDFFGERLSGELKGEEVAA